ncbi:uncharacterized protein Dana_GF24621 [Drosophila ananassae]|uniref:Uncharacterized protein n=1 Tax=Drosophila ananassae TaxID=7217 RepID=B3MUE3_DROAN|nr:uncharacterized protein Dana_GF24621 [Drosophila ananassae]
MSQEALWRLQLAAGQSQQIYVERPPSAFSGLVDYSGYSPHIQTVTSSLSQQSFVAGGPAPAQPLAPHEMLQAAQRYGTLRKSAGKQPPLPPQRKDLGQQPKPQQQMGIPKAEISSCLGEFWQEARPRMEKSPWEK